MKDSWTPPGRDCGACGLARCDLFIEAMEKGEKKKEDCPFSAGPDIARTVLRCAVGSEPLDILNLPFDFVLHPLPDECSARKIILPFRPDLVERWDIRPGDILTGRPMGAGCPVQHVLRVLDANQVTGVVTTHVVGPAFSRGKEVKDLEAYHIIGFEGIAEPVREEPVFGRRMRFLPGFCMMNLGHTGVVNLIMDTRDGIRVRVEDIRIL